MRVAIRADASSHIGSGHIMRCLTLAERLRKDGADVLFICRNHEGNLVYLLEERGFAVSLLVRPDSRANLVGYAVWLGVSQMDDARETAAAIARWGSADWLIVDHYALDAEWETAMRSVAARLLVVDDLANRKHDCDVLLDQNLVADFELRYNPFLKDVTKRLLGPDYALLQPDYAAFAANRPADTGGERRVLIFMGAADRGVTLKALQGFVALQRNDLACDVVVPESNPQRLEIKRLAASHPNICLYGQLPSLAPLMAGAALAVGAGGATSWERLCLGLRSIVVILAENQRPIAEELHRRGLVMLLGDAATVTANDFCEGLAAQLQQKIAPLEGNTVDGRGVERVLAVMTVNSKAPLTLRRAYPSDESLLLRWANDPVTRASSFSPDRIPADGHHRWFTAKLVAPQYCRIFIAETTTNVPLGQVRLELQNGVWVIDYSVAPEFRGRGLARLLLQQAARHMAAGDVLTGEVLPGNEASHRVFRSLGYHSVLGPDGITRYKKHL